MEKLFGLVLALLLAMVVTAQSAEARGGRHGGGSHLSFGVTVGPTWWGPGWIGGPYYPYYPYYPPPVIVQQPSDIYVQPAPPAAEPVYWYYCPDPQGYYPEVKRCPQGWLKVVPSAEAPEGGE